MSSSSFSPMPVKRLRVLLHGEGAAHTRLPDVLLVIVVLADHKNLTGDEVRRVAADTELTDHGDVAARGHRLHEGLAARRRDRAEVVDELVLAQPDASEAPPCPSAR